MAFRTRIALAAAVAVAAAVVTASVAAYVLVRSELRGEVDAALARQAPGTPSPGDDILEPRRPRFGGPPGYVQVVTADGRTLRPRGATDELPVTDAALAVARGEQVEAFEDVRADGAHLRMRTTALRSGAAVQIARPLDEVDAVLDRLRTWLLLVGAGGVVLAAALGLAVARTAIGPLRRLTETAEDVARTRDLSRRVGVQGDDELGRLGARFDEMLGALETSERAQRQLVSDASHELRTPITAVRASVELLARHDDLPATEREAALRIAREQLEELSALVTDVVDLARDGTEPEAPRAAFRLDEVVEAAVERARAAAPGLTFDVDAEPCIVDGVPDRAARAVTNVLDNAIKWTAPGGRVTVTVAGATVTVRDGGPGFDPTDVPHVFERFYRSPSARGTPGSGLGLAIVRQVAELHGGSVEAENAPGGGAIVRVRFSPDS
jgi:two-component system sensor histidine kinase MprB